MARGITIVAGPCAAETRTQTMNMGYKISLIGGIAKPFGIEYKFRAGAWKPRTAISDGRGGKVFEGTREEGLQWLSEVAKTYGLPIVTECMSEDDFRHFGRYLVPERDHIQVGARNSLNYALLYQIGGSSFGVVRRMARIPRKPPAQSRGWKKTGI